MIVTSDLHVHALTCLECLVLNMPSVKSTVYVLLIPYIETKICACKDSKGQNTAVCDYYVKQLRASGTALLTHLLLYIYGYWLC